MAGTGEEPLNRELYRIPGHAGWFSWNNIHPIERESLVEFFEGKTLSKTPKIYKDYRDFMINKFRENPRRNLSFTELRKMLIGDVNCLRRVFDFLEKWGLINNSQLFSDSPETTNTTTNITTGTPTSPPVVSVAPPGLQIVHKSINLGSRENVFQKGGNKAQQGEEWSQQELMLLLEAVSKHGDNWARVQQHVGTKTKSQCVKQFVQLPFGDQFLSDEGELPLHASSKALENGSAPQQQQQQQHHHPAKKQKVAPADGKVKPSSQPADLLEETGITPLLDSSNPILSQIAFMSAMVGPRVAAAAAEAALAVIAEEEPAVAQLSLLKEAKEHKEKDQKEHHKEHKEVHHKEEHDQHGDSDSSGHEAGTTEALQSDEQGEEGTIKDQTRISAAQMRAGLATALAAAAVNAKHKASQEEREIELLMANIIETQLKKLQSKLEHFEELEHLMEKERLQLEQMREQVFIDRIQLMRQQFPGGGNVAVNAPGSSHQEKLA